MRQTFLTDESPGLESSTIDLFLKRFPKFIRDLQALNFLLMKKVSLTKNSTSGLNQLTYEKKHYK